MTLTAERENLCLKEIELLRSSENLVLTDSDNTTKINSYSTINFSCIKIFFSYLCS